MIWGSGSVHRVPVLSVSISKAAIGNGLVGLQVLQLDASAHDWPGEDRTDDEAHVSRRRGRDAAAGIGRQGAREGALSGGLPIASSVPHSPTVAHAAAAVARIARSCTFLTPKPAKTATTAQFAQAQPSFDSTLLSSFPGTIKPVPRPGRRVLRAAQIALASATIHDPRSNRIAEPPTRTDNRDLDFDDKIPEAESEARRDPPTPEPDRVQHRLLPACFPWKMSRRLPSQWRPTRS